MNNYTKEESVEALQVITSTIMNCEKIHPKFAEGSSQHTLLKNRIKALYISKTLIINEGSTGEYSIEDLKMALPPITSIISKCEKAQLKLIEGSSQYTRLKKIIRAMYLSKAFILNEIDEMNQ